MVCPAVGRLRAAHCFTSTSMGSVAHGASLGSHSSSGCGMVMVVSRSIHPSRQVNERPNAVVALGEMWEKLMRCNGGSPVEVKAGALVPGLHEEVQRK